MEEELIRVTEELTKAKNMLAVDEIILEASLNTVKRISKQKGFWQGLAITTSIAGVYYIYKNFKLKCKVADLEDTIAIKEAIYESEEA